MFENLIQLVVLFFVIFDPLASFVVFLAATAKMKETDKKRTAMLSVAVAAILSYVVLFFGNTLLTLFNTSIENFRIAGGIILVMLGIKMTLGLSLVNTEKDSKDNSVRAIAALIGTPLLTGPAAISSIIIAVNDYGFFITGLAITIIMAATAAMFYESFRFKRFLSPTTIQVLSTILGLVTLAWGVEFIRVGLGF